ncbi:hypothetical protein [Bacillus sp. TL12]|nr:hypothetical protein [Bacillus sp. TL12]MCI0767398.1 hypothetical protein [Bacillus sp. TL12]
MEKVQVEDVEMEIKAELSGIVNVAQKGDSISYEMLLKIKEAIGSI